MKGDHMLTDDELFEKCNNNEPITKEDLAINTSHDCPYQLRKCEECDGRFCRGMHYINKNGLTIFRG